MAKDFNWDEFETVNPNPEVSQDSSFNWDQFETVEPEKRDLASIVNEEKQAQASQPSEEISKSRSALIGAGQGASLGFGEEITAPVVAAAGMIGGAISPEEKIPTLPGESLLDKYQRLMQVYRDVAREEQKAAKEQNPYSYTGGAVAGGVLSSFAPGAKELFQGVRSAGGIVGRGAESAIGAVLPKAAPLIGKVAAGATEGATLGALAGAGESEGGLKERAEGATEMAKTGAIVGGAIPAAGAVLGKGKEFAEEIGQLPYVKKTLEAFRRGTKGENLITEAGRREASGIVRGKGVELAQDITKLEKDIGTRIGQEIDQATETGATIDLTDEVDEILPKLQQIKKEGSQEAAAYASSIEKEIKKILGIKSVDDEVLGVARENLPEGFIVPDAQKVDLSQVTPKQAQDVKQVLYRYASKMNMTPQEYEGAALAGQLSRVSKEKLNDVTDMLPELNKQFTTIKGVFDRLKLNEKDLPEQTVDKINRVFTRLEKESVSGDEARQIVKEVVNDIETLSPEIASKYKNELTDVVERLKLAEEIGKGLQNFGWGTFQALGKAGANIAGLTLNKTKATALTPVVTAPVNFASAVLQKAGTPGAMVKGVVQSPAGTAKIQDMANYQRLVASAAEKADPELLKSQAQEIRSKYGQQGEQLAIILDNMSQKDKDARRALMFTVLQNPAHRKMLGITNEEEK